MAPIKLGPVSANDRLRSRGAARSRRIRGELASEFRDARVRAGMSQSDLGGRVGMSGDKIWQIEHERLPSLSIVDTCEIAAVLGMDFVARLYPNGSPVRDAGQARRLTNFLSHVAAPLSHRTDVALPQTTDRVEMRAWDAVVYGAEERTGIELESRLGDVQATTRRHHLKRRDDPVDHFLMLVANTRHNRRVVAEFQPLMSELPRLRTATVLESLSNGRHPGSGLVLF